MASQAAWQVETPSASQLWSNGASPSQSWPSQSSYLFTNDSEQEIGAKINDLKIGDKIVSICDVTRPAGEQIHRGAIGVVKAVTGDGIQVEFPGMKSVKLLPNQYTRAVEPSDVGILSGTWAFNDFSGRQCVYKLVAHGDEYFFAERLLGHNIVGNLRLTGDWYQGRLYRDGDHLGFIRLRLKGESILSNFRKQVEDHWHDDIVAHRHSEAEDPDAERHILPQNNHIRLPPAVEAAQNLSSNAAPFVPSGTSYQNQMAQMGPWEHQNTAMNSYSGGDSNHSTSVPSFSSGTYGAHSTTEAGPHTASKPASNAVAKPSNAQAKPANTGTQPVTEILSAQPPPRKSKSQGKALT